MVRLYEGKIEQSLRLREVKLFFFPFAYKKNSSCGFCHQKLNFTFIKHPANCTHIFDSNHVTHPDEINEALNINN